MLVLVLMLGCNPVANCEWFPASDCCETDDQCFNFYGPEFPICVLPGRRGGGTCGECAENADCVGDRVCVVLDETRQTSCLDPGSYYTTDWSDL